MVRVLTVDDEYIEQDNPDTAILAALARAPQARMLRRLELVYDMRHHPFDFEQFTQGPNQAVTEAEKEEEYPGTGMLDFLLQSPHLTNLRCFKLGFSDGSDPLGHSTMVAPFAGCTAQQVIRLLEKWPRLEELYLNTDRTDVTQLFASPKLGNLRVLQCYFQMGAYPLQTLAKNKSLRRLTHLRLHPGRETTIDLADLKAILKSPNLPCLTHLQVHMTNFGDDGCRAIIESGILRRLKELDLGYGNMTDEGALLLADCPDLNNLDELDVRRNALSATGIAALEAEGITVIADDQHAADADEYLYEVDFE